MPLFHDVWMWYFQLLIFVLYYNHFNTILRSYYALLFNDIFYCLQLYMCLNIVAPRGWLLTVAQTCRSAFGNQMLVQLVGNKLVYVCQLRGRCEILNLIIFFMSVFSAVFRFCSVTQNLLVVKTKFKAKER
jgi:hypothetical protein